MKPNRASSSYPPASFFAADRIVNIELEVAETLAGLAHSSISETENKTRVGDESVNKRVDNESPARDSLSDLHQDHEEMVWQHCEKICKTPTKLVNRQQYVDPTPNPVFTCYASSSGGGCGSGSGSMAKQNLTEELKAEKESRFDPTPNPVFTSYASSSGGCGSSGSMAKQDLTEAEKELKRLRRVFANRESARKTIRRRQALYEELARKAVDLVVENDKLKREKESATKEYNSVKNTNEYLKAEMAKIEKAETEKSEMAEIKKAKVEEIHGDEVEEIRDDGEGTREELKSVNITSFASTSCPLFIYKPPFLPFHWPQTVTAIPSQLPIPTTKKSEQENPLSQDPNTPLYIWPYPCLFPLHHHHQSNGHHPQYFNPNGKLKVTSLNNQCSSSNSSSKSILHEEIRQCGILGRKNEEYIVRRSENVVVLNGLGRKNEEYIVRTNQNVVDVAAAAEARKKRKEVTKSKKKEVKMLKKKEVKNLKSLI